MRITIESTDKVVELETAEGAIVPARIWQGTTARGVPVTVFVTRISPDVSTDDPLIEQHTRQFEEELQEQVPPRARVQAIPLRLIL